MITYSYSDDGMERRTYFDGELCAIHIWSGLAWREPIDLLTVADFVSFKLATNDVIDRILSDR